MVMITMSSHEGCQSQQWDVFANHLGDTRSFTSGRGEECQEVSETAGRKHVLKKKRVQRKLCQNRNPELESLPAS